MMNIYKLIQKLVLLTVIIVVLLIANKAHAIDWTNDPALSDTTSQVLTDLKDRDIANATMNFDSDSNIPTGAIRYNTSSERIEKFNGTSWVDALADYSDHLSDTANPHSVTHSQVGSATAQWNASKIQDLDVVIASITDNELLAYDSTSGDFLNQTAAEAGLATTAGLSSHTSNTSNPHSVTAAQAAALAIANNLSDVANAGTARTNLGLGSLATISSVNNSNWSGTDLSVANGGTGSSSASGARSNLSAAESGTNSDITSLTAVTSVGNTSGDVIVQASSSGAAEAIFKFGSTNAWKVTATNIYPSNGAKDVGRDGDPIQTLYFNEKLIKKNSRQDYTLNTWSVDRSLSSSPDTTELRNVVASLIADLVDIGLIE